MAIRCTRPERAIICITNDLVMQLPNNPVIVCNFFLNPLLHLSGTYCYCFERDDRVENVPVVDLRNPFGVAFGRSANTQIPSHACLCNSGAERLAFEAPMPNIFTATKNSLSSSASLSS